MHSRSSALLGTPLSARGLGATGHFHEVAQTLALPYL